MFHWLVKWKRYKLYQSHLYLLPDNADSCSPAADGILAVVTHLPEEVVTNWNVNIADPIYCPVLSAGKGEARCPVKVPFRSKLCRPFALELLSGTPVPPKANVPLSRAKWKS
jgi:hypothetical protein